MATDSTDFFNQRALEGHFDVFSDLDRQRLIDMLDDVHFPVGKPVSVLDCGCGTGRAMDVIAGRLGSGASITGVDLSPAMIERARSIRKPPEGVSFDFAVADCLALPFEPGLFDWVVVFNSFPHFKDQSKALSEFARVLKEGGFLSILESRSSADTAAHHRRIGGPVEHDQMPTPLEFIQMVRDAGLWLQIYIDDDDGFRLLARR